MSLAQSLTRRVVAPFLELLLGRRNLVRLARSLTLASRLDVPNAIGVNGELVVQRVVREECRDGMVAFDVGANRGEWSRCLLTDAAGGSVSVHAFEPASATVRLLRENLRPWDGKVQIVQAAVSSRTGTAEFFIVGEGLGTNSLHARAGAEQKTETVQLTTVDAYCAQHNIARIDLLKIDAEGHDFEVLAGAAQMLSGKRIRLLQFEYNQRWIDSRHFLKDAFDLLLPLGYHIGKVTPRGIEFYPYYHFELESFREANYVACLPEWAGRFAQVKWWNLP